MGLMYVRRGHSKKSCLPVVKLKPNGAFSKTAMTRPGKKYRGTAGYGMQAEIAGKGMTFDNKTIDRLANDHS